MSNKILNNIDTKDVWIDVETVAKLKDVTKRAIRLSLSNDRYEYKVETVKGGKTYKIKLSIETTIYQEVSCVYGEVAQMPEGYTDPVQEGKVFVGWFYNADTTKEQFVFGNVLESTKTTYKAVFEDAPSE